MVEWGKRSDSELSRRTGIRGVAVSQSLAEVGSNSQSAIAGGNSRGDAFLLVFTRSPPPPTTFTVRAAHGAPRGQERRFRRQALDERIDLRRLHAERGRTRRRRHAPGSTRRFRRKVVEPRQCRRPTGQRGGRCVLYLERQRDAHVEASDVPDRVKEKDAYAPNDNLTEELIFDPINGRSQFRNSRSTPDRAGTRQ